MTVLSGKTLRHLKPVIPFSERTVRNGMSYGLSHCGIDVCVDLAYLNGKACLLRPGDFMLASTVEQFDMPVHIMAIVHDKSTWARRGLALQNTVIEPGWRGYLTLEITNHGNDTIDLMHGDPIAQIVFHALDQPADPYVGKYQDQERGAQPPRYEGVS